MLHPATISDPMGGALGDEVARGELEATLRPCRELRIRQARALWRLDAARQHRLEGCATLGEWGERHGLTPVETRTLARVGEALPRIPDLEAALIEGTLTFDAAAELGRVTRPHPDEPASKRRPIARWLHLAKITSTRELKRVVAHVMAARRLGAAPARLEILLSPETLALWRRARIVARHREKRRLTEDEFTRLLVEDFLERHDLTRKKAGKRRLADTRTTSGRPVPAEVRRVVWERDGGRCVVPGCTWDGEVHLGHIHPNAKGGWQEEDNTVLLCPLHNDMERYGVVRLTGPGWNPGFQWRFGGDEDAPVERSLQGKAEERRRRAEVARRKWLGTAPPAEERREPYDIDIERLDDGWRTDDRLQVPWLDAIDLSMLDRWLTDFFEQPP